MLSGEPGRFSTKISVLPLFSPSSQCLTHLFLIHTKNVKNDVSAWNNTDITQIRERHSWPKEDQKITPRDKDMYLLTSKFHRPQDNLDP